MEQSVDYYVKYYKKYFPEFTVASLRKAISVIIRKYNSLSSITLNHYMVSPTYGGKGYGRLLAKKKKR